MIHDRSVCHAASDSCVVLLRLGPSRHFLQMERSFTFIHRLTRRMTECGQRVRNGKSTAAGCLFNVPSFPPESWCQQECVTMVKGSFILCTRRPRSTVSITSMIGCPS